MIFTSSATSAIKLLFENFNWNSNFEDEEFYHDTQSDFFQNSSQSSSPTGQSAFVYTQSNHTSVVGGRELAQEKNIPFYCLGYEEANTLMSDHNHVPTNETYPTCNSIFAYPAQCNYSGKKYPLEWIKKVHTGILDSYGNSNRKRHSKWFCLLDAASYCSTSDLDLSQVHPDFVCISFYKIFGYPTGLGALLVRNQSGYVLKKKYFGGGTVEIALPFQNYHKKRKTLHER